MCPAIHISSRSWLRSSSTHEPSDPPPRIVLGLLCISSPEGEEIPSKSRYTKSAKKLRGAPAGHKRNDRPDLAASPPAGYQLSPVSLNRLRWTRELVAAAQATVAGSPGGSPQVHELVHVCWYSRRLQGEPRSATGGPCKKVTLLVLAY